MGRYRRKPWEVDAWCFTGVGALAPEFVSDALKAGVMFWQGGDDPHFTIDTAAGGIKVWPGEWIIREPDGTFLRAAPAIFSALYEPADAATAIELNQLILPRQAPGPDDHTLERADDVNAKEEAGPPVVFAAYKPPRDPRVQPVLKAAAAERAAEGARVAPPIATFRDPRLEPNYKPPKRPNQPR